VDVIALGLLFVLGLAALGLYREQPPTTRPRRRAGATLTAALVLLAGAGWTAWRAAPVHGVAGEVAVVLTAWAAVVAGGPAATAVLRLAESAHAPPGTPSPANPLVLRGGAWIGVLERISITASLLLGWPEGLALTLAVKGLGRYPDLRTPGAAERFIIGTFASVLWACACAGVGWALLA